MRDKESDMPNGVKTARTAFKIAGWLSVLTALVVLGIFLYGAVILGLSRDEHTLLGSAILGNTGILIVLLSSALGIFNFIIAGAISRRKKWARIAGIILGFLLLPGLPTGTVISIVILSGLLSKNAGPWFESP